MHRVTPIIFTFPDPYPDELAYSLFARYIDRMRFPVRHQAFIELFGTPDAVIAVDFPYNISYLLNALPPSQGFTADEFINNHTLLPYYAPFLTIERVERIRRHILGVGETGDRRGLTALRSGFSRWLRICPSCAQEEQQTLGESYWHRLAQVPGVEICPIHRVWLETTNVSSNNFLSNDQLVPAHHAQIVHTSHPHHISQQAFETLVYIAQLVQQLLQQGVVTIGHTSLQERYRWLLYERGYVSLKGFVSWHRLIPDFIAHLDGDLLYMLNCNLDPQTRGNWFTQLICDSQHTKPPLHHVLLLQFLGYTIQSIRTVSPIDKPFGDGSWPCLNKTCHHYNELCIETCTVEPYKSDNRKIKARFACGCGFVYWRTYPAASVEHKYGYSSVEHYGHVWEKALREYWVDSSLSLIEIQRRLNVGERKLLRYAAQLDLPPRPDSRKLPTPVLKTIRKEASFEEVLREQYQKEWLEVRQRHPTAGMKFFQQNYSSLRQWLYSHNREWFYAHRPPRVQNYSKKPRKPWEIIDSDLVERVRKAVQVRREAPGRPERITRTALLRDIGYTPWFNTKVKKHLPQTDAALKAEAETIMQWVNRRIEWAKEYFCSQGKVPTSMRLMHYCGIRTYKDWLEVQEAVHCGIRDIEIAIKNL